MFVISYASQLGWLIPECCVLFQTRTYHSILKLCQHQLFRWNISTTKIPMSIFPMLFSHLLSHFHIASNNAGDGQSLHSINGLHIKGKQHHVLFCNILMKKKYIEQTESPCCILWWCHLDRFYSYHWGCTPACNVDAVFIWWNCCINCGLLYSSF